MRQMSNLSSSTENESMNPAIGAPPQTSPEAVLASDITERKKAEQARAEAERKYREIFDNASEGIFQSVPDGRYVAANPALARMYGYESPEDLIQSCSDISRQIYVNAKRRDEFKRLIERDGVVRLFEYEAYRKDRSKFWISVNARAVRNGSGEILFYEGTGQDITERKRAEQRSAAFANLAHSLSGASTYSDAASVIAETAQNLFGWDACNLDLYDAATDTVTPLLNVDTLEGERRDVTASVPEGRPTSRARRVIVDGPDLLLRESPIQFDPGAVPFGNLAQPSASIMSVPITHGSEIIGLLSIQSYSVNAYDELRLQDLTALADHCGEAINRIRAEQSLRESEEGFRQLAENIEDIIWVTDGDFSKVFYVNPGYERIFGRPCEELYQDMGAFLEAVHPDDREGFRRLLERQKHGEFSRYEFRLMRPDGTMRWVQRRAFPIRNEAGEICRIAGIGEDITDRKQAQEALRISEQKYKNIFYFAPIGICQTQLDGAILTANQTLADMLGYQSTEELLRLNMFTDVYFDPADRRRLIEEFEHGDVAGDLEIRWKRKDGALIWVHLIVHTFKVNGVTQHFEGFVRDITEQKAASEALAESEERYRELFENSRDAIYVHDLNGRYTSVNRAAEELSGFSRDEIIGKHYSNFIAPNYLREARESFCRKLDVPVETTYEAQVICKDGCRKSVEVNSRMMYRNGEPIGIQGTVRDITERKRAQRTLQTYSQRLIQAQEAERESMSRELHDEIGQALTAISMNLEWIRRSDTASPAVSARVHESIEVIDDTLQRVRELSLELRPSLLDDLGLAAALSWYAERFSTRAGIETEVLGELPPEGVPRAVQTALFRITQEALTNIARHARATKARVDLAECDHNLRLTISDDGVGFDAPSFLNGSSGMALGLRGMQERAHAANGSVFINSRPGSTEVVVEVPITIPMKLSPTLSDSD